MKHITKIKDEDESETTYAIHEVYYTEDGKVKNWTKEPASVIADTADFSWVLERLADAVKKPTLDYTTGEELAA